MSQTFQEYILSMSTLESGTFLEHIQNLEAGEPVDPPDPEIVYVPTYIQTYGTEYSVSYNSHEPLSIDYVHHNNDLGVNYEIKSSPLEVHYELEYLEYEIKYINKTIEVRYNGTS